MNILIYRYGSICEPDVIQAFQELGNSITEITLEVTCKNPSGELRVKTVSNYLLKKSYDFVFSINFFPFLSEVCNIFHIRYLCWTVDSPVMELYSDSIANPWNRIFIFDQADYQEFLPYNPNCIFHLPLATNVNRWNDIISSTPPPVAVSYQCEVSFVGSLYTEKCPYDRLENPPAYLKGYLDALIEAQLKIYGYNFLNEVLPDSIVTTFKHHLPGFYTPPENMRCDDRAALSQIYLGAKISAEERLRIMRFLGERYALSLYTGSDTSHLPVQNKGLVKTLTEMPLVFNNSKINLNITSKSIRTGLPLRIFDALGCGGFLITNYQAELPSYFTPGEDLICYESMDDLSEKVAYFLSHDKERQEIAACGYQKVKQYHTYEERLLTMLSLAFNIT